MNILDWIIIIIVVIQVFSGFRMGIIYPIGNIIGLFLGIKLSAIIRAYLPDVIPEAASFTIILSAIVIVAGFVAVIINKAFDIIKWFPFLKTINRLLGAVFFGTLGILFLSVIFFVYSLFPFSDTISAYIEGSIFVARLVSLGEILASYAF